MVHHKSGLILFFRIPAFYGHPEPINLHWRRLGRCWCPLVFLIIITIIFSSAFYPFNRSSWSNWVKITTRWPKTDLPSLSKSTRIAEVGDATLFLTTIPLYFYFYVWEKLFSLPCIHIEWPYFLLVFPSAFGQRSGYHLTQLVNILAGADVHIASSRQVLLLLMKHILVLLLMTPTTVYDESPATEYEQPLLYLFFYDYFTPHVPVIFFLYSN